MRCAGSSIFLKRLYGVGYVLTLVKEPSSKKEPILDLLKGYVPDITTSTDVGAELTLRVPLSASAQFPAMFQALDRAAASEWTHACGGVRCGMEMVQVMYLWETGARACWTFFSPHRMPPSSLSFAPPDNRPWHFFVRNQCDDNGRCVFAGST